MSSESSSGKLEAIYIASNKGQPMDSLKIALACKDRGLVGDRYWANRGTVLRRPGTRQEFRQVTFVAQEAIIAANQEYDTDFAAEDTRRNILTSGIELNDLVGVRFHISQVAFLGFELCDPCGRIDKLKGRPDFRFRSAFAGQGGLCAAVLNDGYVRVGDNITAP